MCFKVVGAAPTRKAIVTWEDFRFSDTAQADSLHFSAVLYEGSDKVEILCHEMTSVDSLRAAGSSATIGLQDDSGTIAASSGGEQFGTGASAAYAPIP